MTKVIILFFFIAICSIYAEPYLLFSVDSEFQTDLDAGHIPKAIIDEFGKIDILKNEKASLWIKNPRIEWVILFEDINQYYPVKKDGDKLNVYIRQLNYGDESTLKLEIIGNNRFCVDEPILITIKFTNISKTEILDIMLPIRLNVNFIINSISRCSIFDSKNNMIPPKQKHPESDMMGAQSYPLKPNQIFSKTFNLLDYFDIRQQIAKDGARTGKYTVRYIYNLMPFIKDNSGQSTFIGQLYDSLDFEIVSDGNDRELVRIFQSAVKRQLAQEKNNPLVISNVVIQNYRKIINEYPKGYYSEYSLFLLAKYYDDKWLLIDAMQTYDEFLKNYPESYLADIAQNNRKVAQNKMEQKQVYIQELIKKRAEK